MFFAVLRNRKWLTEGMLSLLSSVSVGLLVLLLVGRLLHTTTSCKQAPSAPSYTQPPLYLSACNIDLLINHKQQYEWTHAKTGGVSSACGRSFLPTSVSYEAL